MADDDATGRRPTKATRGAPKKAAVKKVVAKAAPARVTMKAPAANRPPDAVEVPLARKAVVKKAVVKRSVGRKATASAGPPPATGTRGAVLAGRERQPPPMRLAAEQTFDDDPREEPAPEPVREDPAARVRGLLRAAALSLEGRQEPSRAAAPSAPSKAPPTPPPGPAAPPVPALAPAPDQLVTRTLVSPVADDSGPEISDPEDDGDWSPPDVLDEPPAAVSPPPPTGPPPPATAPSLEPQVTAASPPPAVQEKPERRGAGLSIVAIVLALVVPLVGAIAGIVLAGRARRRGAALAGVARVVSVLALVGWLVGAGVLGYAALRDQGVDYSQLKVGDCFDSSQSNEVRGVKVKPCSESHNSEIFFLVTHPAGPKEAYPGRDQLVQFAADACLGKPLTEYLGIPLEQSTLKDFEIVPQESAWEDGRRLLVCGIDTGGQGDITGSVMGTRR